MHIDFYSRVETGDEIPDDPHAYNEFLQDLFCSKAGRARISDCYMHELACIATQYIAISILCIGPYCGMYCGMYWWYVLNTYQHVFNTNRYVFNTYLSVLVCIVLVLRTY